MCSSLFALSHINKKRISDHQATSQNPSSRTSVPEGTQARFFSYRDSNYVSVDKQPNQSKANKNKEHVTIHALWLESKTKLLPCHGKPQNCHNRFACVNIAIKIKWCVSAPSAVAYNHSLHTSLDINRHSIILPVLFYFLFHCSP